MSPKLAKNRNVTFLENFLHEDLLFTRWHGRTPGEASIPIMHDGPLGVPVSAIFKNLSKRAKKHHSIVSFLSLFVRMYLWNFTTLKLFHLFSTAMIQRSTNKYIVIWYKYLYTGALQYFCSFSNQVIYVTQKCWQHQLWKEYNYDKHSFFILLSWHKWCIITQRELFYLRFSNGSTFEFFQSPKSHCKVTVNFPVIVVTLQKQKLTHVWIVTVLSSISNAVYSTVPLVEREVLDLLSITQKSL